jgi:hypothetical protein
MGVGSYEKMCLWDGRRNISINSFVTVVGSFSRIPFSSWGEIWKEIWSDVNWILALGRGDCFYNMCCSRRHILGKFSWIQGGRKLIFERLLSCTVTLFPFLSKTNRTNHQKCCKIQVSTGGNDKFVQVHASGHRTRNIPGRYRWVRREASNTLAFRDQRKSGKSNSLELRSFDRLRLSVVNEICRAWARGLFQLVSKLFWTVINYSGIWLPNWLAAIDSYTEHALPSFANNRDVAGKWPMLMLANPSCWELNRIVQGTSRSAFQLDHSTVNSGLTD